MQHANTFHDLRAEIYKPPGMRKKASGANIDGRIIKQG
jgi:hypothetical protein